MLSYFSRGFCTWAWLHKEAGRPVLCTFSCPSALPFGGYRSLHRTDQEERGRKCEFNTPLQLCSRCVFESSNFLFGSLWQVDVYEVNVSDDLQQQLHSVVQELGIQIPPPVSVGQKTCVMYLLVVYEYVPATLYCFSLRTPAVQYLWYKGSWLNLSPHKGRAWREWCHGRHRRSTGIHGPAPTSMKDRWHLWVCCCALKFSYRMISIKFSVLYFVQRIRKRIVLIFGLQCTPEQISTDLLQELNYQLEQDQNLQTVRLHEIKIGVLWVLLLVWVFGVVVA